MSKQKLTLVLLLVTLLVTILSGALLGVATPADRTPSLGHSQPLVIADNPTYTPTPQDSRPICTNGGNGC